jgi:PhzF family phenazine biosynthesis protein
MKIPICQVDAFTSPVFSGNPAAVCILEEWLDDRRLQSIAEENNLAETAFLVRNKDDFELRWFTLTTEVDLCGPATLTTAFVLSVCLKWNQDTIRFQTRKSGELRVTKKDEILEMDFTARPASPQVAPDGLSRALGVTPEKVYGSEEDLMVVLDGEKAVVQIQPDLAALEQMDCRGVIITAQDDECDFVSRFFAPRVGVPEDPVTGSAHCVLIPYWEKVLNRKHLHARQVSKRGGELFCRLVDDRVKISGKAALYLEGTITI